MNRRLRHVPVAAAIAVAFLATGSARGDVPPLTITPPADISVAATAPCGQTWCAVVTYSFTVTGGVPPYRLVCNLDSGSAFIVGSHTITCFAQDHAADTSPPASFTLTVTGGGPPSPPPPPPPMLTFTPPADISVPATAPCGQTYCAVVPFALTAAGGYPPYTFVCNFYSGDLFTVGAHTVTCIAQDSEDDSTPPASFTVTVTGGGPPLPPQPPPPMLSISPPDDISVPATAPCGQTYCAVVSYSFTVSGGYPPYRLVCNLDSGGLFTLGSHTVSCLAQDSEGDSTPQASFTLTVTPAIGSFAPTSGGPGSTVVLTGTAFGGVSAVAFAGTPAKSFRIVSPTQLTAIVAPGTGSGAVTLTTAQGQVTSVTDFVSKLAPPIVRTVSPGAAHVGDAVTITGQHFSSASGIAFNGVEATTFRVVSDVSIVATVPAGATTGVVSVDYPGGTARSGGVFTVLPATTAAPTIASFAPAMGIRGTRVTLRGSGFTGATSVTFGGAAAAFTIVNDSTIVAIVPPHAATGAIRISSSGGTVASSQFTVR